MTDYNSLQKRKNYIVGAFVLIAFLAFLWMLGRFRDMPLFVSQANSFYVMAKFRDASGVQRETPVQFCGYQIGRVVLVSPPTPEKDANTGKSWHDVKVTMAIDKKYNTIPSNVNVLLMKRGLGSSYIELRENTDAPAAPLIANRPETRFLCDELEINGSTGLNSEFFPPETQKKLENLLDSITTLAANTNQIIGDEQNKTNIKKTLDRIATAAEQTRQTLESVQKFSDVGTEKMTQVAEDLDAAAKEFRQVLEKINNGDGSAGKFLNDGRLYENLLDSSAELEMALEQIKKWAADAREKGIRIKW
ncbi:MAG: MCE family protein [Planctomycetes bacterium]|nr:MCE family protein [Planctomycetota bacterium]